MISCHRIIKSFMTKQARDFSCITAPFPETIAREIRTWGQKNIPQIYLTGDGLENDIHVTCLYGIHNHDPLEIRPIIKGFGKFEITLGKISVFENSEFDVVKIDVESAALRKLNGLLTKKLDNTNDYVYQPHCTIGYLKNGMGIRFVGNDTFKDRKVVIDNILFSGNDYRETVVPL